MEDTTPSITLNKIHGSLQEQNSYSTLFSCSTQDLFAATCFQPPLANKTLSPSEHLLLLHTLSCKLCLVSLNISFGLSFLSFSLDAKPLVHIRTNHWRQTWSRGKGEETMQPGVLTPRKRISLELLILLSHFTYPSPTTSVLYAHLFS